MHHDLLRLAREYLDSIGRADELGGLRFFADDVVQVEFPKCAPASQSSSRIATAR